MQCSSFISTQDLTPNGHREKQVLQVVLVLEIGFARSPNILVIRKI